MSLAIDRSTANPSLAAPSAPTSPAPAGAGGFGAAPAGGDPPLPPLPPDGTLPPLDDTADVPEVLSTALARRAELQLLLARERDQTQQAKLDRMRAEFDNAQLERAELLREMNALRDMAVEQTKKDDEVLKKFIAMI